MSSSLLKNIIDSSSSNIRLSYDTRHEYRHIRCSFISSCNKPLYEILKDWTGNTRFMPFVVSRIKWIRTDIDYRLQVLAEGKEHSKKKIYASDKAQKLLDSYLNILTPESPAQEVLSAFDNRIAAIIEQVHSGGNEFEKDRIQKWLNAGSEEFQGYCPLAHLTELGVIEKIVQQTKYPGRKVHLHLRQERGHRNSNGEIIPKKVGLAPTRGYYFKTDGLEADDLDDENVPF